MENKIFSARILFFNLCFNLQQGSGFKSQFINKEYEVKFGRGG